MHSLACLAFINDITQLIGGGKNLEANNLTGLEYGKRLNLRDSIYEWPLKICGLV